MIVKSIRSRGLIFKRHTKVKAQFQGLQRSATMYQTKTRWLTLPNQSWSLSSAKKARRHSKLTSASATWVHFSPTCSTRWTKRVKWSHWISQMRKVSRKPSNFARSRATANATVRTYLDDFWPSPLSWQSKSCSRRMRRRWLCRMRHGKWHFSRPWSWAM